MSVEALPEAIEDIREKSLLIRRGTEIPESLNEIKIKAQRIVADWMLIGNFRLPAFERQVNCLGWYLFYIPPEVKVAALALHRRHAVGRALKKLLRKAESERLNTLEITAIQAKEVIGLSRARLAGCMRHIQAGPFLFQPAPVEEMRRQSLRRTV